MRVRAGLIVATQVTDQADSLRIELSLHGERLSRLIHCEIWRARVLLRIYRRPNLLHTAILRWQLLLFWFPWRSDGTAGTHATVNVLLFLLCRLQNLDQAAQSAPSLVAILGMRCASYLE